MLLLLLLLLLLFGVNRAGTLLRKGRCQTRSSASGGWCGTTTSL
jgi:hypothetical protein